MKALGPRASRVLFLLVLLPLLAALAEVVAADPSDSYKEAILALDDKKWGEGLDALRRAIGERPEPGGRPVLVYGRRYEAYLPYFHAGLASYHLGDCNGALDFWSTSESRGEILGDKRRLKTLRELSEECRQAAPEPASPPPPTESAPEPTPTPSFEPPPPPADLPTPTPTPPEEEPETSPPVPEPAAEKRPSASEDLLQVRRKLDEARNLEARLEERLSSVRWEELDPNWLVRFERERAATESRLAALARQLPGSSAEAATVRRLEREAGEVRSSFDRLLREVEERRRQVEDTRRARAEEESKPAATDAAVLARSVETRDPSGSDRTPDDIPEAEEPGRPHGDETREVSAPREVVAAAESYLAGDYRSVLEEVASIETTSPLGGLSACLLESAASWALSRLVTGEEADGFEARASTAAESCRELAPEFSPSNRDFSPAFLEFYGTAGTSS